MTFDCTTKQLDVHIQVSEGIQVIPQVLSLSNLVLSLQVTLGASPQFQSVILSANTQLFSINTFVAVEYKFDTKSFAIKGVPMNKASLNIQKVLQAVSGASLKVPSGMNTISQVTFLGQIENGITTIAIKGKSEKSAVAVLLQISGSTRNAALIADIDNFNLASFVKTALNIDITSIQLFGTLTIPKFGFSAATGKITSSLLPRLYVPGSPLEKFGDTLPKSVSAYFTVNIAGVNVDATFSIHKFTFKVPETTSLSVKQILDQIPKLSNLDSLPKMVTNVLNSKVFSFNYDPESKFLELGFTIPQLILIPNMLKLTTVNFMLGAIIGQNPTIQTLKFSGTWKFNTVILTTSIDYDAEKKVFQIKAAPESSDTPLSIETLVKNIAGVGGKLPNVLTSLSLSHIVGNVYDNGKYFLAMSGTVSGGKLYLLFYKDTQGVKIGIAASLQSFQLSTLVQSTIGADITSVPFFGNLVVPAMAVCITSGLIKSPALPHLFGEGSPLLFYGDRIPAGVTSQFDFDFGDVKGAIGKFNNGMLVFQLPESVDFNVQALASKIPGISSAIQTLPPQIRDILSAKVTSFSFNTTSKDLSITASLSKLTLVSGFLSISNVLISYDGTLGKTPATRMLDFSGAWNIGEYAIVTSVMYNGASKELTIASHSGSGKELSISNVVQSLAGTTVPLPSAISSFTITGITGKIAEGTTLVVLNGKVGSGKISTVFQKTSSGSAGAVVVDISNFKLVELVKSATGADISAIPFFGTLQIPELKFAAATNTITTPILGELAGTGSALEWFKTGISKGISGRFVIQIGNINRVAVNFVHKRLDFKVPDSSSLTLDSVLSVMPKVKDVLSSLPSQFSTIFSAKIAAFSYDPDLNELHFSGSLDSTFKAVPQFVSLSKVQISLVLVLGQNTHIKALDFSGDWMLKNLLIRTGVSYNRREDRLDITGELNTASGGINIQELIKAISGQSLSIPPVLSSVKLSKLSGNKIGDVTLVTLSGSVGSGHIFLIYQKSPSGSAVAFAADTHEFRFSALVSSATGIDISSIPFFGNLEIPQIGFTIASKHINNPFLSAIFPPNSPLAKFSGSIFKGVTASFSIDLANVKGIIADFAKGELDLQVPKTVDLSLTSVLTLIPGLQGLMDSLPQTIQDIGQTNLNKLYFVPSTKELQLTGSLDSLAIIPNFPSLQNIQFEFSGIIGKRSQLKFVKFKGDWIIKSLSPITTEVFYKKNLLLINGYPTKDRGVNVKDLIKGLTDTDLNIPSVLDALKFTQVIGKIQDGILSIVLMGEIGTKAKVSIVYERSKDDKIVAFAADIQEFQLSELVKVGTGVDITDVPYFGKITIPDLSFVISSKQFTTANLPDLNIKGVHIPKILLLESIPAGVKAQYLADIGSAVGVNADFSDNVLTIEVPSSVSLSLQTLLSVIPEIKSTIDSLPPTVRDILSARITKLLFKPTSQDLFISLSLDTLTLVSDVISIKDLKISLDTSMTSSKIQVLVQRDNLQAAWPYRGLNAEDQAVSVNKLEISALWVICGIKILTTVTYDKHQKSFNIHGNADSNDVSIADIIRGFTSDSIPVPSVLSSLKLTTVVAVSSDKVTTVILTAMTGSENVYILFQKTPSSSATAVAAEIESFKIVDLIKTATGLDLTRVPFISSFVVSSMGFSVSTNPINTPLLAATFDSDGPLHTYGTTLPKGVTAHFEVQIAGKIGVTVSYQKKKLVFVIPSKTSLSFSDLLSEIPSLNSVMKALPSPLDDILSSRLLAMDFDATTKILSVAASLNKLTIIPNTLEVANIKVKFVAILSSTKGVLQSLDFTADWVLENIQIKVKISYDKKSSEVIFTAIPKEGLNIQQLLSSLTKTNIPVPSTINTVKFAKIVGQKKSSVFTIIFSGTIPNKAGVHLVYQNKGTISSIAIAAGISSFKFAELVQLAVNIDISSVPFFGTFSVPSMALTISNGKIKTHLLSDILVASSPLVKYGDTIPDGFTAKFDVPIGNIKGIIGTYSNRVLSFTVPPSVDASLSSLISVIPGVDVNSIGIAPFFGDILSIRPKCFEFDILKKMMTIELFLKEITFYEELLSVRDINLKLFATLSTPRTLSVKARGEIALGKTNFEVNIQRDPKTTKYALTVETEKLSISSIVSAIGATFLPEDLTIILGKIFQFDILNLKIVYPFGATPQQIQLSGTPQIFGLKIVNITAVAIKYSGKIRLIQKYDFGSFNIADMIKKLVGVSLHSFKILDQEANIEFVLSPSTIKGVKLTLPEFRGYSINQGITISAPMDWPDDCSSDAFCNVCYTLLGGAKLSLEGTITSAKSFILTAAIGDLKLGGGIVLLHSGLQFIVSTNPTVGIVGSIEMKEPPITLTAAIRLAKEGVKLEGSMGGCWYNAFGNPYFTICNLLLSMTINLSQQPLSGLEFGGRIEVGKQSCGHVLTAEGYVGMYVINPSENYFYADVGPITFQKFFDAFCINVNLPKPLGDSGFPNGFKISFSLLGRELPHARIIIPSGYRLRGTLNFLGLEAYANIYLQPPTRINVEIRLPPLTIGGVLKIYKSSTDTKAGPYYNVDITTKRPPKVEASVFVKVFGISVEAKLLITISKYHLEIAGKFLNLFEARLVIAAQYSKSITKGSFLVEGWFQNDLFDKIAKMVRDALSKSANEADKHIKYAQNKINLEKAKFDSANAELESAKRKVDDANRAFNVAIGKLNDARRKVDSVCRSKQCRSGMAHNY